MPHDNPQQFSPVVEYLLPDATIEKKIEAQANLDAFMDVMYRIYLRFEEEGRFPLKEDSLESIHGISHRTEK